MKIEIKNRYTNEVIFTHECEDNTIKKTVEEAVRHGVNLSYSDLSGSDLSGSDLKGSNLSYSDLKDSNLRGSKNLDKTVKLPMYCKWTHGITNGNLIHIGCEKKTIEEWDLFFSSDEVISTKRGTQEFKQIQAVFEAYKAYFNILNA